MKASSSLAQALLILLCIALGLGLTGCSHTGDFVIVNDSGSTIVVLTPNDKITLLNKEEKTFGGPDLGEKIKFIARGAEFVFKVPVVEGIYWAKKGPKSTAFLIVGAGCKLYVGEKVGQKIRVVSPQPSGFPQQAEKQP